MSDIDGNNVQQISSNQLTMGNLREFHLDFIPSNNSTKIDKKSIPTKTLEHAPRFEFDKKTFAAFDCKEQSKLKSTPYYQDNAQNFTTEIEFMNNSNSIIITYFIDFEGNKRLYSSIPPNSKVNQPTYLNHIWMLTDANNNCLLTITSISKSKQIIKIEN